ncbi:pleckstrin homology domain-containing family O member 1-like [Syngnathus acus]|uniref:pleckstrin homology domain-containing family O member 1-like n=1 Tax=Syngnathus acus TaxID=161584 RepID=UPI001885FC60|nr:pleckstrin homology domain-containing family O member 1-like [Syngnathus acus]
MKPESATPKCVCQGWPPQERPDISLNLVVAFQVTVDEAQLCHLTRDRGRICHVRRPPSRGHLLAVVGHHFRLVKLYVVSAMLVPLKFVLAPFFKASSSNGTVNLGLIHKGDVPAPCEPDSRHPEDSPTTSDRPGSSPDGALFAKTAEGSRKSQSFPRETMERLLAVAQDPPARDQPEGRDKKGTQSVEEIRAEASCLLKEALEALEQALQVLHEVKELRNLQCQLDQSQDSLQDQHHSST